MDQLSSAGLSVKAVFEPGADFVGELNTSAEQELRSIASKHTEYSSANKSQQYKRLATSRAATLHQPKLGQPMQIKRRRSRKQ